MDYLDLLKWIAVGIFVILYTMFFFELFDYYFFGPMKDKILMTHDVNQSVIEAELQKEIILNAVN